MPEPTDPDEEIRLRARLLAAAWAATAIAIVPMSLYAVWRGEVAPAMAILSGAVVHAMAGVLLRLGHGVASGRLLCVGMLATIAVITYGQHDPLPVIAAVVPVLIAAAVLPLVDLLAVGGVVLGLNVGLGVRHLLLGVPAMVDDHSLIVSLQLGALLNLSAVGLGFARRRGTDRLLDQTRRDREQLEQVFRQAGVGLVLLDARGEVVRRNPAAGEVLGGLPLHEAEADPPAHIRLASVALQQGGRLVVLQDQREAVQRARLLRQARDAALEASEAKSVFLANMSHELRTPLNAIIGYAEMLVDSPDLADDDRPDAERIGRAGRQLLQLIDDILDLARVEAGRLVLSPELLDVDDLVQQVVDDLAGRRNEGVQLRTRCDGDTPFVGDRKAVRQVLTNLVSNAVKYTPSGHIEVRADRHRGGLTLRVSDTGTGMDEQTVARLFERFYRDRDARAPGTGLGMAIVQQLVQRMGGTVTARSTLGVGTTITVHLPSGELRTSPVSADRSGAE